MKPEQIALLLKPFLGKIELSEQQLAAIQAYFDLLLEWNSKLNLTSIRDPEEIIERHFGESLFAATQIFPAVESSSTLIDIGSGGGFPALPIKILSPRLKVTLIESKHRKATFLREVVRALSLNDAEVLCARAESASARAHVVTLRAVEHFEEILPIAKGLVQPGGRIALLIGVSQVESAQELMPELKRQEIFAIPKSKSRVLMLGEL